MSRDFSINVIHNVVKDIHNVINIGQKAIIQIIKYIVKDINDKASFGQSQRRKLTEALNSLSVKS